MKESHSRRWLLVSESGAETQRKANLCCFERVRIGVWARVRVGAEEDVSRKQAHATSSPSPLLFFSLLLSSPPFPTHVKINNHMQRCLTGDGYLVGRGVAVTVVTGVRCVRCVCEGVLLGLNVMLCREKNKKKKGRRWRMKGRRYVWNVTCEMR